MVVFVLERVNYKTAFEKKILKYAKETRYYRSLEEVKKYNKNISEYRG